MPAFLEAKLKKEYPDDPKAPFKVMNALGYMHGNKETEKGKEADTQHAEDVAAGKTKSPFGKPKKKIGWRQVATEPPTDRGQR